MKNWNSHHSEKIKAEIRLLMKANADLNGTISAFNHLVRKQVDYVLETKYRMPTEIKLVVAPDTELSIGEFLVYAGERLQLDYVDILFGEYNEVTPDQMLERLDKNTREAVTAWIDDVDQAIILTIDETKSCQTFIIRTTRSYCFLVENWLI